MGLTGFNRQRKRALSAELDIDERLADKLMAYGYSTPQAVKDAESFPFLSDEELKQFRKEPSGDTKDLTVKEITQKVSEIEDLEVLNDWLETEANNKDRKTAKEAIQSRIDELSEDTDDSSNEDEDSGGSKDDSEGETEGSEKKSDEDTSEPEEKPEPVEVSDVDDLDEEFLALPDDTVFPHKITAGWHYLSNGEKVNGTAASQKAQAELDGG